MSYGDDRRWQDHGRPTIAVAALHIAIGYWLISGFAVQFIRSEQQSFKVVTIAPPPPPAKAAPIPSILPAARNDEGEASKANLAATATPVVKIEPIIKLPQPPTLVTASKPNDDRAAAAGAASQVGPGNAAGISGDGIGQGRDGLGNGGGGNGGDGLGNQIAAPPAHRSGAISRKDIPRAVWRTGTGGTVTARFMVEVDGRASECRIVQSSGHAELDSKTCAIIEQRFQFRPARNQRGQPMRAAYGWKQDWWFRGNQ